MDIYLLSYNNYYNRIYKREETLSAYLSFLVYQVAGVNTWANGDGVDNSWTTGIVSGDISGVDYMLTCTGDKILGRWFVIEKNEISKNRYKLTLRRDLLAESLPTIENDAFFAERCIIPDTSPYIYNTEDISVNRIKTKETLIKDETQVPWIVGYLNRSYAGGLIEGNMEITPFRTYNTLEEFEYHNYIDNWFNGYTSNESTWFTLYWNKTAYLNKWIRSWDIKANSITQKSDWRSSQFLGYRTLINGNEGDFPTLEAIKVTFGTNTWIQDIRDRFGIKSLEQTTSLLSYDNVIIKVAETYYRIHIKDEPRTYEETLNRREATDNAPTIKSLCESLNGSLVPTPFDQAVYTFHSSGIRYKVELEILSTNKGFSFTIPAQRPILDDAPYDMFAIPYGKYNNYGDKQIAMKTASTIMSKLNVGSTSELYDVQLLPFSPALSTTTTDIKDASDNVIGKIYWATESSFSKTILLNDPIGVEDKKIDRICNKYRLVSPNYNGQFEFTAAANNGISGFKVDATYLPINPYIRIAPLFGGLYGGEFRDARGLICGGDFSFPVANSAWISYQQNNKQYQNIFDRQIKNIEFTQEQQRIQERWNAATGVVSGAIQGGQMGAAAGPWGAAVGAVIGAGVSLAGAGLDQYYNELARREAIGYSKDVHRLSLQNIQAQPDSLARTTAFNATNKIFPILEYFTCTDEEKKAVAKSISENSMRAGFVTTIAEIARNRWSYGDLEDRGYISGKLMRASLNEDPHYLISLNSELLTGFYRR